jgi:CubicO group peptidase (beta-lactamase class C family)
MAGYILQRVSGESWGDYIENRIFKPLEMTHSAIRHPLPDNLKDVGVEWLRSRVGACETV